MQKVFIQCTLNQKEDVIHILQVNNFEPLVFQNKQDTILQLSVYDYQISILVKILIDYSKDINIFIGHQIKRYETSLY